jgi:hypothetical protein
MILIAKQDNLAAKTFDAQAFSDLQSGLAGADNDHSLAHAVPFAFAVVFNANFA